MRFHYHIRRNGGGQWRGYWVRKRNGKLIRHTPKFAVDCPGQPAD